MKPSFRSIANPRVSRRRTSLTSGVILGTGPNSSRVRALNASFIIDPFYGPHLPPLLVAGSTCCAITLRAPYMATIASYVAVSPGTASTGGVSDAIHDHDASEVSTTVPAGMQTRPIGHPPPSIWKRYAIAHLL